MRSIALVALACVASTAVATPEYDPNHGQHNYIGRHGSTTTSSPAPVAPSPPPATATATTTTTGSASAKPTEAAGSDKNATTPAVAAGSAAAQSTTKAQDKNVGFKVQVGSTFALLAVSGALVIGL